MTRLRRSLGRLAVAWLLVQSAALAAAPVIVAVTAEDPLECTCAHGDHTYCPMHHKNAPSSTRCQMRSSGNGDAAVLSSLFTAVGVLSSPVAVSVPQPRVTTIVAEVTRTSERPASPDPPPPRA